MHLALLIILFASCATPYERAQKRMGNLLERFPGLQKHDSSSVNNQIDISFSDSTGSIIIDEPEPLVFYVFDTTGFISSNKCDSLIRDGFRKGKGSKVIRDIDTSFSWHQENDTSSTNITVRIVFKNGKLYPSVTGKTLSKCVTKIDIVAPVITPKRKFPWWGYALIVAGSFGFFFGLAHSFKKK